MFCRVRNFVANGITCIFYFTEEVEYSTSISTLELKFVSYKYCTLYKYSVHLQDGYKKRFNLWEAVFKLNPLS